MSFPNPPKSYLDRVGKDATILGVFVILLFAEVAHQLHFSSSLISENMTLKVLLSFPLIFSFVVFVLGMKLFFTAFYLMMSRLFINAIVDIGFEVSYKVAFGSFMSGVLLIVHGWTTNTTNMLANYIGLEKYSPLCYGCGAIFICLIAICNWDSKTDSSAD